MLLFSLPKLPNCVMTFKEHLKCYQNRKLCVVSESSVDDTVTSGVQRYIEMGENKEEFSSEEAIE